MFLLHLTIVLGHSLLSSPAVQGDIPGSLGRAFATETEKATVGLSQQPLKDLISFLNRRNKKSILYHLLNHYIYVQLFKLVLNETEQGTQDIYECSNTSLKKRQLSFHGWSVLSQKRQ